MCIKDKSPELVGLCLAVLARLSQQLYVCTELPIGYGQKSSKVLELDNPTIEITKANLVYQMTNRHSSGNQSCNPDKSLKWESKCAYCMIYLFICDKPLAGAKGEQLVREKQF